MKYLFYILFIFISIPDSFGQSFNGRYTYWKEGTSITFDFDSITNNFAYIYSTDKVCFGKLGHFKYKKNILKLHFKKSFRPESCWIDSKPRKKNYTIKLKIDNFDGQKFNFQFTKKGPIHVITKEKKNDKSYP